MSIPFRYRKLGYVALNVTDIERSIRFYTDMVGLDLSEPLGAGPVFLRCGADHHHVVLYPAAAPGVKRVAFELESRAEMEHARKHLASLGLAVEDIPVQERAALRQGDGLRFVEPNSGLTFELYTRVLQMALPFRQSVTKIVRLGIPDRFIEHGERAIQLADAGIDAAAILKAVSQRLDRPDLLVAARETLSV